MNTHHGTTSEEDVPGLLSDDHVTDDEDDANILQKCTKDMSGETSEEDLAANAFNAALALTSSKRTSSYLKSTPDLAKRSKKDHNITHASKLQCMDIQEIKECLASKGCACGEACFGRLKGFGTRAVRAIENLRLQRFAGKLAHPSQTLTTTFPHPGVKIYS